MGGQFVRKGAGTNAASGAENKPRRTPVSMMWLGTPLLARQGCKRRAHTCQCTRKVEGLNLASNLFEAQLQALAQGLLVFRKEVDGHRVVVGQQGLESGQHTRVYPLFRHLLQHRLIGVRQGFLYCCNQRGQTFGERDQRRFPLAPRQGRPA